MTTARRGLKVKVKVVGQVNAVGATSIVGSFFIVLVAAGMLCEFLRVFFKADNISQKIQIYTTSKPHV